MSRHAMGELKEMLCYEVDEITSRGSMTARDVEMLFKLTTILKNIDKVMPMDGHSWDGGQGGDYSQRRRYSRDGDWEARGRYGYDDGGNSYRNRGQHYVRGHYSRDGGREEMMEQLEQMMQQAEGKHREIIREAMEELREA